jgi:hypothetical protein
MTDIEAALERVSGDGSVQVGTYFKEAKILADHVRSLQSQLEAVNEKLAVAEAGERLAWNRAKEREAQYREAAGDRDKWITAKDKAEAAVRKIGAELDHERAPIDAITECVVTWIRAQNAALKQAEESAAYANGEWQRAEAKLADCERHENCYGPEPIRQLEANWKEAEQQRRAAESRAATLAEELKTLKSLEQQAWHKAQFELERAVKAEAKSAKDVEWAKGMRQSYEDELLGLKQMLRIECGQFEAAQATIKAKDEEIKKLVLAIGDHITARAERQATIKSLSAQNEKMREALRTLRQNANSADPFWALGSKQTMLVDAALTPPPSEKEGTISDITPGADPSLDGGAADYADMQDPGAAEKP